MSADSTESKAIEPADKPSRNPVERVIVWGLIGALLVTVGIEARAQQGYANSLDAVQAAFADTEEVQIDLADARKLMTLSPVEVKDADASGLMDYYQFSWFSLFKSGEYEITLRVSKDSSEVISFATSAAPESGLALTRYVPSEDEMPELEDYSDGGYSGGGLSGEDGNWSSGGEFQPPPDLLFSSLDADSDGEISAEEIEGAVAVLESLDSNGDGELTPEEFDPDGLGRRGGGFESGGFGSGGFGSGGADGNELDSGRSRRPEIEE